MAGFIARGRFFAFSSFQCLAVGAHLILIVITASIVSGAIDLLVIGANEPDGNLGVAQKKGTAMNKHIGTILALAVLMITAASAQSILFDFNNVAATTTLPISVTVGDLRADFSGTGDNFSVQSANVLGFTPAGFSGNCLYPGGINGGDLHIAFSQAITDFSILYAPEEYGADASATMRVTAYSNGNFAGTTTTNAQAGTWPSETLAIHAASGFNSVVVHYDAPPLNPQEGWGPIFMADNVNVTLLPPPIVLTGATKLPGGEFQFSFTNLPGGANTVLATTNLMWPQTNWSVLGIASELLPGQYQFTDAQATNGGQRFYRVQSP